jgi:hypothetical protein
MKTYARIKDGKVVSCILLDDITLLPLFLEGFDYIIEISTELNSPGSGWSYDIINGFTPGG